MPIKGGPRFIAALIIGSALLGFLFVSSFRNTEYGRYGMVDGVMKGIPNVLPQVQPNSNVISSKLGNETAKAELGRASWKYFHSVMARFPDKPTSEESKALGDYIYLFQRLYPCGECAAHFGDVLKRFPPQTSSRSAAAVWGCHVHNEVNKSLGKEEFDCANIGDFYDCGCADDKKGESKEHSTVSS